jgi:hypothetical protein
MTPGAAEYRRKLAGALALILLVSAARLAYLIWFSPYELVGDEAYYWVQSQHLDWSYREKGPLLAWAIALCCHLFGNVEWAVRLPMVICSALAAWGIGRMTLSFTNGDRRAALLAVIIFLLVPAFVANAQICTQDGPLIALLVALTALGLRLTRRWESGDSIWLEWLGLWALFALGMLLKQSTLLFATAFVPYVVVRFHQLRWRRVLLVQQLTGLLLLLAIIGPMLLWEHRHGWPMLGHTLGHLGIGSDHATKANKANHLAWIGSTIGGIVGAAGPAFIVLAAWASWDAIRRRNTEPDRWPRRLWLICAAWPSVLFFVALSFTKPVVPSWPLPSLVPLVVLVAEMASHNLPMLKRPQAIRAKQFKLWWDILIWYGVGGALLIMFPTVLAWMPIAGAKIDRGILHRLRGSRSAAQSLYATAMRVPTPDGRRPIVVTRHYMNASLDSFYIPHGALTVTTFGGYTGLRPSNFDTWDETRLSNPAFHGRSLLLVNGTEAEWQQRLQVDSIRCIQADPCLFLATNFQGGRHAQAQAQAHAHVTEELP